MPKIHLKGKPFYQGAVKSAFWGAATGGFSFGIGEVAQTIGNAYLRFGFQAAAHGLYNGIASELQGGKFVHGFSAGAISSIGAGLAKDVLKLGTVPQIFVGGILGGTSASIAGGDFFRGFAQGLILSAFNHSIHNSSEDGGGEGGDPPQIGDKRYESAGPGGAFTEYTYTENGWVSKFYPDSGAVQTTDSPIEWVIGAWKTPFQAIDDIAILGFAKFGGGNSKNIVKISESVLKKNDINAHILKQEFLGKSAQISKYDLYSHKSNNETLIYLKGGVGKGINTGYFLK